MAKKRILNKGIFIIFEGPEGSGKSTQSALAAGFLTEEGYDVVYTREPGGTALGDKIREVLLESKNIKISDIAEALLFEASRSELVGEVIKPALLKKRIVISDRFNMATLVYQGSAGGVPLKDIRRIESVSMLGVKPDLTIVLDIDAEEGLKRIGPGGKDRMESKRLSYHRRVREGYLKLARLNKKRIKVITTKEAIKETFEDVKKEILDVVKRYSRP